MKINRLKSKLKLFYTIFIAPPKEWQLPKKSEVLIYDAAGAETLALYLTKYRVVIMAVRGEAINMPCLLRAALTLKFWKGKLLQAYTEKFIQEKAIENLVKILENYRQTSNNNTSGVYLDE